MAAAEARIFRNFLNLGVANVGSRVLGFLTVMYLSRVLLPQGFGEISLAMAIVSYSTLLLNLGFDTYGAREVAKDKSKVAGLVNAIMTMRLLLSIVAFALTVVAAFIFIHDVEIRTLTILYGITLFCTALTLNWVFWGLEKLSVVSAAQILGSGIYLACAFFFIKERAGIYMVPLFYVLGMTATLSVTNIIYRKKIARFKFNFDWPLWKVALRDSIPMGMSIVVISFYSYFNYILLGTLATARDVGIYSAAYKILELVSIIAVLTWQAFFPSLSQTFTENREQLQQLGQRFVQVMLTVGLPVGLGCFVLADQIVVFIYGPGFSESTASLRVLSISCVGAYLSVSFGNSLLAFNHQRYYLFAVATAATVNVLLALSLIKTWGPLGAATSTTIAEVTAATLMYIKFRQYVVLRLSSVLGRVFLPTVGVLLLLIFSRYLGLHIVLTLIGSTAVYVMIVSFRYIHATLELVLGKIKSSLLS
jgi:O-antigen/teichoic acid export membrane protein